MKKEAEAISVIGGVDGPTAVFMLNENPKLTLKQKIERLIHKAKRAHVEKTLIAESHTLDEVMEYIVNEYGFVELEDISKEEYNQTRASAILEHAPELLGEYAKMPELNSTSQEDMQKYLELLEERTQKALEVPVEEFDIDFHRFRKSFGDVNDYIDITIEKKFASIGGCAVGNKRIMRKFEHINKDVYRYYGVTEEDIAIKSERYKHLVQTLSM